MDTGTGYIAPASEFKKKLTRRDFERFIKPIDPANLSPKVRAMVEATGRGKISRNSRCPCGSWKRFKRCCMAKG